MTTLKEHIESGIKHEKRINKLFDRIEISIAELNSFGFNQEQIDDLIQAIYRKRGMK